MGKRYTNEEKNFLKENYPKYGSLYCSRKLNRPIAALHKQCSKLKLNRKHRQKHPNLMNVNVEQFWNIDKPEVAYYLGFMWGDGHILNYKSGGIECHRIALEILSEDADKIIPTLNKIGKWGIVKRQRKHWKPVTGIIINNKAIYEFLEQHDYRNKSLVSPFKIIKKFPDHLLPYFWRRGESYFFTKN